MSGKRIRVLAVVLALCMFVGCMTYAEEVPAAAPETAAVETEQPAEVETPATETTEEPATESSEEPTTESSEEPTTETTEEPATETAEEPATETTEEPATETAEETATETAEEPATETAEEPATETAEEAATKTTEAAPEECAHKHVIEWDSFEDGNYTPKDSKSHTVTGYMTHEKICGDCGDSLGTTVDEKETSRVEAHMFMEGGMCDLCGYENGCAHKYTGTRTQGEWSEDEELECTPVDEVYHIFRGDLYQETFCLTCGEVLKSELIKHGNEGIEEHQWNFGTCWICEYDRGCRHENTVESEDPDYAYAEVKSFDEDGHTLVISAKVVSEECKDCGEVVSERRVKIEPVEKVEGHYFEGESCATCGYVIPCEHKTTYVDTYDEDRVMSYDADGHTVAVYRYEGTFCEDCDTALGVVLDEIGRFETSEHTFEDGVCTVCDYEETAVSEECAHKHVIEWDNIEDGIYTPKDSKSHTVTGHMRHEKICGDCGDTLETTVDEKETSRVEAHIFEGGACELCGYESGCAHKYTGTRTQGEWSEDEELECTPVDEVYHIFRGDLYQETFCLTCGEVLKSELIKHGNEGIEEHQFNFGGVCWICEYDRGCRHENTVESEDPDYAYAEVKSFDEDGHTLVISAKVVSEECKDCGEVVSERRVAIEPYEEIIGHYFEGESCATCGYVNPCEHKSTYVDTYSDDTVMSYDEKGHTVAVYRYKGTFCEDCDTALDVTLDEIGRFETSEHTFEDGVCTICDYEKAEADPTMPTVTDEPIVTPTMPAVTDTPKATQKPAEPVWVEKTIAEITIQMDADVAAQGGSIRIVNAEKVLTPDELTALNALPVKEQMLTFLSVIGVEEPVNSMLAERQESLSDGAEALKAQVLARIAAMDDATREEFDIALLECFPEETVTIDGVEYNFFVIDLEVRTGDGVRYERYGFRREGDEWIFACLEVAE